MYFYTDRSKAVFLLWFLAVTSALSLYFGNSLRAMEEREERGVETYCCNVICGAPTTSEVKGLRRDEIR